MNRSERDVLNKLGRGGLVRVLDARLDQGRLLQLANAVAVGYPGMRLQSQKRERILSDLADKALREDAAGRSVVRALRKQLARSLREWSSLDAEERRRRLSAPPPSDNPSDGLGLVLFLAASAPAEDAVEEALDALLAKLGPATPADDAPAPANAAPVAPLEREILRLRKKSAELQKKVRHLEVQIVKNREGEKLLKRDLMQRKGELAEARMLAERLRRDAVEARAGAGTPPPKTSPAPSLPADGALGEIERVLKRLATDHRKLTHRVENLSVAPAPATPTLPPAILEPIRVAVEEVGRDVAALRRERKKDLQEQAARLEKVEAAFRGENAAPAASSRSSRPALRRKGDPERVGVFIDVQNVYYGARQLKGKLDFETLLQAAVLDRRLIQATAYVVETKEIDQSGFIAMLQQRAIEVRRKNLQIRADGSMKGDWDMEMALDILDMTPKLDVVVLVSGDGDFTSLVKRVKGMGPRVEVLAFPRNTAKSLLEAADRFQPLDRRYMIRAGEAESDRTAPAPAPAPAAAPAAAK